MSRTITRTFKRESEGASRYVEQPEQGKDPVLGQLELAAT